MGLTNYADSTHAQLEPLYKKFSDDAVVTAMVVLRLATLLKSNKVSPVHRERLQ